MSKAKQIAKKVVVKTVPSKKNRLAQLAAARDAYFREMGFGKFRKEKPAAKKAPKAVPVSRGRVTQLAKAREAYFRKMGFGKYAKKAA